MSHRINLEPEAQPVMQISYLGDPKRKEFVADEVERMLNAKLGEPSSFKWASSVLIVLKRDGLHRMCTAYQKFNAVTVRDTYAIPRMDECTGFLGGAAIFSTLDASHGHWQTPVAQEDSDKTIFTSHAGMYRFKRVPFELVNAPATLPRALKIVNKRFTWKSVLVYLEDITIFSRNNDQRLQNTENFLSNFHAEGVSLKLRKCHRFTTKVKYPGQTVTPQTFSITEAHTKGLRELKHPRTLTGLRLILVMCNVYRRFLPNCSA